MTRDRINLSEKGESVKTELEKAEVLNEFFSNIVNNLEISKYSEYESFIDNIEDQTLRAIIAIQNKFKDGDVFCFRELKEEEIQKEIDKLNNNNSDIFNDFLYVSINSSIKSSYL